ncbi:MAG TPA: HIT domain-containing protein [Caulobacteraceae bacterium]|nr:HIT domain-containing protein [Caulobacteraceae bacterium]
MFRLDPVFERLSRPLASLALCEARLMDDARFPWLVLAPRRDGAVELEDLAGADRGQLMAEIVAAGRAARAVGEALARPVAKLNVGQLGNLTRQLHVHVVGRREDDPCWPGPVWGQGAAAPYRPIDLERAMDAAGRRLAEADRR